LVTAICIIQRLKGLLCVCCFWGGVVLGWFFVGKAYLGVL